MKPHINPTYIIIGALCVVIYFLLTNMQELKRQNESKDSIIAEKNATIQYHVNNEGHLIAEKEAAEATAREVTKAYPEIVEELRKEFDVKMNDVKAYVKNQFTASGSGNSVVHHYHGGEGQKYPYWELKAFDGYLDFTAQVYDSGNAPYAYAYTDTMTTVVHSKRRWSFRKGDWSFGKEKLYASSMLRNPNAKITGATNILVDSYKDKRWVVSAGVSYVPFVPVDKPMQRFQPTVSLGYALFKF